METLVFRTLFYSAAGIFLSHGLLKQSQFGKNYFLIHGLVVSLIALVSLAFNSRPSLSIFLFIGSSVVFSLIAGRMQKISWVVFALGFFTSIAVIYLDWGLRSPYSQVSTGLYFLGNAGLSSLMLGLVITAMLVGHWYLVRPTLSIDELKRVVYVMALVIGLRFVLGTYMLTSLLASKSELELYRFLSHSPGLFILMRYFWGLLGPAVLAWMILGTVKIRSTQSATGILYVAVICILTGEILSQYLAHFHGIAF